ncbi:MAG: hypothetical protein IKC81_04570, partial [Paludibacteraceae bacterium]|nr:hypothetical protein [Paludibacteraceae bacterium]
MQKITDTYKTPIRGGRSEKWWLNNPGQLDKGKNAKHRTQITSKTPDIDIRKFLDEFSLKGVEFGNWLGQGERYDHLLSAGAAINELSKLVGKNVGFDGNVGIAFGARGVKGAAAHFECVENMINLTKRSGAGTLAHEYGHAIDFNIGAFCDQHKTYAYLSGGRSTAATLSDNVGWEMRAMVNQIVDYVKTTGSFKKLFERTYPNSPYWYRRTEVFARFFEQYVAYKTQSKNAYLCKPWDKYVNGLNKLAYLQEDEFKQILPVADKLVARIKDYVSNNGLPLEKAAYPIAIVYKPKDAPAPGTAATKQPQDTKATKNNGESTGTVKAKINLYDFVGKDKLRPVLMGVYHDPKGYAVATDGWIFIADKELFNAELSGKVIGKKGEDLTKYKPYPKWHILLEEKDKKMKVEIKFNADDVIKFIKSKGLTGKQLKDKQVRLYSHRDYAYRADYLLLFCKAVKRFNVNKVILNSRCHLLVKSDNGYVILAPQEYNSEIALN